MSEPESPESVTPCCREIPNVVGGKDKENKDFKKILASHDVVIDTLNDCLAGREKEVATLNNHLEDRLAQIVDSDNQKLELEKENKAKDGIIKELEAKIKELEAIIKKKD